jgi:hypothetical protein
LHAEGEMNVRGNVEPKIGENIGGVVLFSDDKTQSAQSRAEAILKIS